MKAQLLLSLIAIFMGISAVWAQQVPVQFDELPAEAKVFIVNHFKSPFHHAIKEVLDRKITYSAILEDNTEIEFTESGKWAEIDGEGKTIPYTFIQKQIIDYVNIHYPKESITRIELEKSRYETELSNGLNLKFDSRGTFVKMD